MKHVPAILLSMLPLLSSCDHIDAVGDKVNELKDLRKESTQGIDGMKLGQILDGIKGGAVIQKVGPTQFDDFIADPARLNIVNFQSDESEPSKQFEPVIEEIVAKNELICRLGNVDVDSARVLAEDQQVKSVPDVRFYVDGQLVHRFTGTESRETLENLIQIHTASIIPVTDLSGQLNVGSDSVAGDDSPVPRPAPAANVKPIDEAMKPMKKNWLPPGVSQKK